MSIRSRGSFFGLSTRHTDRDPIHGVLEGLAVASRDCYEAMEPSRAGRPAAAFQCDAHIAGASVRTVTSAGEEAAEEIRRYINSEPPVNV